MKLELLGMNLVLLLLVLSRWAGFVMLAPVIGGRSVPAYVKLGFSVACAIVVFPLIGKGHVAPENPLEYVMVLVQETLIGLALGFISQKILFVIQSAGQIIDIQMGLSMGSLLDPINATPSSLTGNLNVLIASLLLLSTNAHHYLIAAMVRSYEYIPFLGKGPSEGLVNYGMNFIAGTFTSGVQIALPIVGVLVLVEIAMGYIARALPQMNIFVVGMPLKLGIGFMLILWTLPYMANQVGNLFEDVLKQLQFFYKGWAG